MRPDDKLEELLLEYSAGSLSETSSLLVATHLALSPKSRKLVRQMDEIAGAFFSHNIERVADVPTIDPSLLNNVSLLEVADETVADQAPHAHSSLPEPLRSVVGDFESIPWRRKLPGLKEFRLPNRPDGCDAVLYKIKANRSMPRHTHEGDELTLVLEGGFSDHTGSYKAGDVAIADPSVEHRPFADPDGDCLCFAVSDGPLRLTGPVGRLLAGLNRLK